MLDLQANHCSSSNNLTTKQWSTLVLQEIGEDGPSSTHDDNNEDDTHHQNQLLTSSSSSSSSSNALECWPPALQVLRSSASSNNHNGVQLVSYRRKCQTVYSIHDRYRMGSSCSGSSSMGTTNVEVADSGSSSGSSDPASSTRRATAIGTTATATVMRNNPNHPRGTTKQIQRTPAAVVPLPSSSSSTGSKQKNSHDTTSRSAAGFDGTTAPTAGMAAAAATTAAAPLQPNWASKESSTKKVWPPLVAVKPQREGSITKNDAENESPATTIEETSQHPRYSTTTAIKTTYIRNNFSISSGYAKPPPSQPQIPSLSSCTATQSSSSSSSSLLVGCCLDLPAPTETVWSCDLCQVDQMTSREFWHHCLGSTHLQRVQHHEQQVIVPSPPEPEEELKEEPVVVPQQSSASTTTVEPMNDEWSVVVPNVRHPDEVDEDNDETVDRSRVDSTTSSTTVSMATSVMEEENVELETLTTIQGQAAIPSNPDTVAVVGTVHDDKEPIVPVKEDDDDGTAKELGAWPCGEAIVGEESGRDGTKNWSCSNSVLQSVENATACQETREDDAINEDQVTQLATTSKDDAAPSDDTNAAALGEIGVDHSQTPRKHSSTKCDDVDSSGKHQKSDVTTESPETLTIKETDEDEDDSFVASRTSHDSDAELGLGDTSSQRLMGDLRDEINADLFHMDALHDELMADMSEAASLMTSLRDDDDHDDDFDDLPSPPTDRKSFLTGTPSKRIVLEFVDESTTQDETVATPLSSRNITKLETLGSGMAGLSSVTAVADSKAISTAPTQGALQENSNILAMSKNENDEFWSCHICHIYRLQERNVESHRLGKKHRAAEADNLKESKNGFDGAAMKAPKVPDLGQEELDCHQNTVLKMTKSDERFAHLELANGSWSCVVCGLHNMKRSDLEPHCRGKKHAAASAAYQQEFALVVEGSWSCTLCDVHGLSTHDLQRHFAGKKHAHGVQQRLREN